MDVQESQKQKESKPKNSLIWNIIYVVLILFVLWIFGIGDLVNDTINRGGVSDNANYVCEMRSDCAQKSICGMNDVCINNNYEPMCISPLSPYRAILSLQNEIPSVVFVCGCSNKKCSFYESHLTISTVWNNTAVSPAGRISFLIKNSGTYTFNAREASNIDVYVDGVKVTDINCSGSIQGPGTTCAVDTTIPFSTVYRSEGPVKIEVKSPVGYGDIHLCWPNQC